MRQRILFTSLLILSIIVQAQKTTPNKKAVIQSLDSQSEKLIEISNAIWKNAEVAFQEVNSSKILSDYAEASGFKVERGVAEMPTAFVATYGSGSPVIGILGEFDALPGLSQKAEPGKIALEPGKAGHGPRAEG